MSLPEEVVRSQPWLRGLCYRMLGDAAAAEDVVQETLWRAHARPPVDLTRPWRPWLATVALRLSRDALRARRRRGWPGVWLPSPVDDDSLADGAPGPEQEVLWRDAASFAWLLAAEALTPAQRAVLLLRDVAGYSGAETADLLGISEGNVKVVLHRARRAVAAVHTDRLVSVGERAEAEAALLGFFGALAAGDPAAARAWLAEDVQVCSDGGGRFHAARVPFGGADKVVQVYTWLLRRGAPPSSMALVWCNGAPALRFAWDNPGEGEPGHTVIRAEVVGGKIRRLDSVVGARAAAGAGAP